MGMDDCILSSVVVVVVAVVAVVVAVAAVVAVAVIVVVVVVVVRLCLTSSARMECWTLHSSCCICVQTLTPELASSRH